MYASYIHQNNYFIKKTLELELQLQVFDYQIVAIFLACISGTMTEKENLELIMYYINWNVLY